MKALVLSGGGLKRAYQIGAYKALRKLNYNFDIVTGTSIGAINGAFITAKEYKKALELWKKVKINFLFQDKVNEDLIVLEYLRNIIENKGMNVEALQKNLNKYLNKNKFFKSNIKKENDYEKAIICGMFSCFLLDQLQQRQEQHPGFGKSAE